jgi:hypothetical protein
MAVTEVYDKPESRYAAPGDAEFRRHLGTYRRFVRGVWIMVAHIAVILALLAYFTL